MNNYIKKIRDLFIIYKLGYIIAIVLFTLWMIFKDPNSYIIHKKLDDNIEKLENKRENLKLKIDTLEKQIEKLKSKDSIEAFLREQYGMTAEGETLFIVEEEQMEEKKKKNK